MPTLQERIDLVTGQVPDGSLVNQNLLALRNASVRQSLSDVSDLFLLPVESFLVANGSLSLRELVVCHTYGGNLGGTGFRQCPLHATAVHEKKETHLTTSGIG
jgi:hypothetical protein